MAPEGVSRLPRVIIQIPCLDEENTLPLTLAAIPRHLEGIGSVQLLVIDDGSTDGTVAVARRLGVENVLVLGTNRGLAKAFVAGINEAARLGADFVVNLDADNQYNADDIPKLLAPLLAGQADMVVGERPIASIENFSPLKKHLQRFGSRVVRSLSRTNVRDSPSGFRAFNRRAMLRLYVFNEHTYTHESLIGARDADLRVIGVPIRVNAGVLRPSRLIKSTFDYVLTSGTTILRFYLLYNPRPLFNTVALGMGLGGVLGVARFLWYYADGRGDGHIQSLVLASVLLIGGMLSFMLSVFSDIIRINRKLLQMVLSELREQRFAAAREPGGGDRARRYMGMGIQ